MKKRLCFFGFLMVVFGLVLLNTLSAVTEDSSGGEPELPTALTDLLSGKNSDTRETLSNIDEAQLPLALAACEALKHKSLHHDIKLSPKAIDAFKTAIEERLENSKSVSFKPTPTCTKKISASEIVIEGKHLTVPEHYLAPEKFTIINFFPVGEAGTLLPDIIVKFTGGKTPIQPKVILDGKALGGGPSFSSPNSFLFRLPSCSDSVLSIGTHTVMAVLADSSGAVSSATWTFTVGMEPVSAPPVPEGAIEVSSFRVNLDSILPNSELRGSVLVKVYETRERKKILEYSSEEENPGQTIAFKTTSVFLLKNFVTKKNKRDVFTIYPRSLHAFEGNTVNLRFSYSGPGKVEKVRWVINFGGTEPYISDENTVSWDLKNNISISLRITIQYEFPNGGTYSEEYIIGKSLRTFGIAVISFLNRFVAILETDTCKAPIFGFRLFDHPDGSGNVLELKEGEIFNYPSNGIGKITVNLARWKIFNENPDAKFENITASETNIFFTKPGFAEFEQDVQLTYDFDDEHYEWKFTPKSTNIYGAYPCSVTTNFAKFPSGAIFDTSRLIKFQKIALEINGEKRTVSGQSGESCIIEPPILLAQSQVFPDARPLLIDSLTPSVIQKVKDGFERLPAVKDFQTNLKYDKPDQVVEKVISARAYFSVSDSGEKRLSKKIKGSEWDYFFLFNHPLTEWLSIIPYSNPADLTTLKIEPENSDVEEGKQVDFKATVLPKPGLGTGQIDSTGGELNLLDGYKVEEVDSITWEASPVKKGEPARNGGGWIFPFKPPTGTASYNITCKVEAPALEIDTESKATVIGSGQTKLNVVDSKLRILYPGNGYAIVGNTPTTFKAGSGGVSPDSLEWLINGQVVGSGLELPVTLTPGPYQVILRSKTNPGETAKVEIRVFDWSFSLVPSSHVYLWEGKSIDVVLQGISKINGQPVSPGLKPIDIGEASVEPQPMTMFWKSEAVKTTVPRFTLSKGKPRDISCTEPEKLLATCTFKTAGRFETLASHSIIITQPGGAKETHFSQVSGSLLGAVKANAEYRFTFEPVRAIVGMTREFTIDAVKIEITGIPTFLVKQFPSTFLEPMEMVKPLLTNRPPIKLTGFDHFGYFGPVVKKEKLGSGKTLDVYFQENFPEGKYLKIWWVPTLYLDNEQELPLAEVVRKIKPDKFSDLIRSRLHAESHELVIGEETQAQFFFGPPSDVADQQGTIFLYDRDYQVTLEGVTWKSNDEILSQNKPNILFSRQFSGKYLLSASGTFSVGPKEGEAFKASYLQAGEPVLPIKVLGNLQIKNAITGDVSDSFKLSYRAKTPFKAVVKYDDNTEESVAVDWKLDGDDITSISMRGKILDLLGIQVTNYHIGCLTGSSSLQIGVPETTFTSFFSGKVKLIANHGKLAKSTTLILSQPTVYCHFKQVEGFEAGDTNKLVKTWIKEANDLWGKENLINIEWRNEEIVKIGNATFSEAIASTSEKKLTASITYLNPLTWDDLLNIKLGIENARLSVVPRQSRFLLQQERATSSVNVFMTEQPYWLFLSNKLDPTRATSISGDDYVKVTATDTRIVDSDEAGIICRANPDMHEWVLAHELGHMLIQIRGNEHNFPDGTPKLAEYLMSEMGAGNYISPEEFLKALDHEKKKVFIMEKFPNEN